ncbi:MAG: PIN domain-containing protein [Saprospiraceae bacterium]|nr:PIN domain-containing protein [Saprospiraceae bacterium]
MIEQIFMAIVSDSKIFVDTNILYYLNDLTSAFGQLSFARLNELRENNNRLFISDQIIREFSHVTLRHAIYNKHNLQESISKVIQTITEFYESFEVLYGTEITMTYWVKLLPSLTTNKDVFDFNIAATLRSNNIQHILTHNSNDFSKFSGWLTILPLFQEQSKKQ